MKLTFNKKSTFYWKHFNNLLQRLSGYFVVFTCLAAIILTNDAFNNYLLFSLLAIWLIWPVSAYFIVTNRIFTKAEKINLLIDGFLFGIFVGYLGLPLWVLLLLGAMFGHYSSSYGLGLAAQFAIVFYSSIAFCYFLLAPGFYPDANWYVITIGFFAMIIVTYSSGLFTHSLIKKLNNNKKLATNALKQVEQANYLLELSIASLDLEEISKLMLRYFKDNLIDFDLLSIQHMDYEGKTLSYQIILSSDDFPFDSQTLKSERIPIDGTLLAEKAITTQKPYIVHDIKNEAVSASDKRFQEISGMKALALFPYFVKNKVSGLVCLYSKEAFNLDKNNVNILSSYIRQISLAINNSLLYTALKENTDKLTRTRQKLEDISSHLGKYLSPQVVDKIFHNKIQEAVQTKKKYLTIFMSDIVSFTNTVDKADAAGLNQELNEELNHYLSTMTKVAFEYGGTVNKYIGDAVMVIFGDPSTSGSRNDALQAVRMADKMLKELDKLNETLKVMRFEGELKIRIGICSGYAAVGNYGSEQHMDYTAVGTVVTLAGHLHDIAEPNTIIVTETTRKLIENNFKMSDYGQYEIQGFDEKIQTWKILFEYLTP